MVGLSWFLAYKRNELRLFEGGAHGGKEGASLSCKKEDPFGGNTQRKISLGGNLFLALKKKKKEI